MAKDTLNKRNKSKKARLDDVAKLPKHLKQINLMAAGIDIGSKSHFVAIPEGIDDVSVKEFASFTPDLHELVHWLKKCNITTVAMESTGVYWIPLYELLESEGFEVLLVDARKIKNVTGRKTDVLDCQWIQQLHTYGLLTGAFRPADQICALRAYMRQRQMLIQHASQHIQHMQKALSQMNLQLHNVISDITGDTGMKIIRAIIAGERNHAVLSQYRDYRCKNSVAIIEKSLTGNYRDEHVFSLTQAMELFDFHQEKILACDIQIEKQLSFFDCQQNNTNTEKGLNSVMNPTKKKKNEFSFDVTSHLIRLTGTDLTSIPGIGALTALKVISEIGLDMTRWGNSKQFASWLGVCPGNKVSGGKQLSSKSKRTSNYASSTFRMAASTLHHSDSALGAFFRRLKSRLGAPKATTAVAHKLAVIFYEMIKNKSEFKETGQDYYEKQYRTRLIKNLTNRAKLLGFDLVESHLVSNS